MPKSIDRRWQPVSTAPVGELVLLGRWEHQWDYETGKKQKLVWREDIGVARKRFLFLFPVLTYEGTRYSHWAVLPDPEEGTNT